MIKNKLRNQKGITLIALVITIIVLLILAGVSITMITSQDGILGKATSAKKANEEQSILEQVKLSVQSAMINENGNVDLETLKQEMNKIGYNDINSLPAEIKIGDKRILISLDGNVTEFSELETLSKQITRKNYGDAIRSSVDISNDKLDEWRVFFKNEKGVYIITKNYIPNSYVKTRNSVVKTRGNYDVGWDTNTIKAYTSKVSAIDSSMAQLFGLSWVNDFQDKDTPSAAGVACLLDQNIWTDLVENKLANAGGKAIGGPTAEMWISSWNEKYEDVDGALGFSTSEEGYYVFGQKEDNSKYSLTKENMQKKEGYKVNEENNLYFPNKASSRYYMASPHNFWGMMMYVRYNGAVGYYGSNAFMDVTTSSSPENWGSLRPVVFIPANVKARYDNNGFWEIFYE